MQPIKYFMLELNMSNIIIPTNISVIKDLEHEDALGIAVISQLDL